MGNTTSQDTDIKPYVTCISTGGAMMRSNIYNWFPEERHLNSQSDCGYKLMYHPSDLGFEVTENDLMQEITDSVAHAKFLGNDESVAIFDVGVVFERYKLWKECFPNAQPFYAMKACDDPTIIGLLAYLGAGFDCASKGEIECALKTGAQPSDIIFANTIKFPSHLRYAEKQGVDLMTFDNEEELIKIKREASTSRLVLRIPPQTPDVLQVNMSVKFGAPLHDVRHLLRKAQDLHLKVVGVSFHVGSGVSDASIYIANISAARRVFDIAAEEGITMNLLDIGGGFFGDASSVQILKKMCSPINDTLERLFPEEIGVTVISEPGRFFVEGAQKVAVCIVGKKCCRSNAKTEEEESVISQQNGTSKGMPKAFEYYLSESMYGLLCFHRFGGNIGYNISPLGKPIDGSTAYPSKLWGPSCDPSDCIQPVCLLPELDIGDWLIVHDVGHYITSSVGTFNGFPKCPVKKIMHRETWENLRSVHQH